jgi:hypothetical protein
MSMILVMPPAAAARVAVSNPSQSVLPGSLMCTWASITPGMITALPKSSALGNFEKWMAVILPSAKLMVAGWSLLSTQQRSQ